MQLNHMKIQESYAIYIGDIVNNIQIKSGRRRQILALYN